MLLPASVLKKAVYTDHYEVQAMTFVVVIALFLSQDIATAGRGMTLQGSLTDESKAILPGVVVSLRNPDGMLWVTTNESGKYSFQGLKPGRYQIQADLPGFLTSSQSVELGTSSTVDLVMKVQSISTGPGVSSVPDLDLTAEPIPTHFRSWVADVSPWLAQIQTYKISASGPAPGWVPKQPTDIGKYNVTIVSKASVPEIATFYREVMRRHGLTIETETEPTETSYSLRSHTKDHAHEVNINAQRSFQTDTIIQLTDSYTLPKN